MSVAYFLDACWKSQKPIFHVQMWCHFGREKKWKDKRKLEVLCWITCLPFQGSILGWWESMFGSILDLWFLRTLQPPCGQENLAFHNFPSQRCPVGAYFQMHDMHDLRQGDHDSDSNPAPSWTRWCAWFLATLYRVSGLMCFSNCANNTIKEVLRLEKWYCRWRKHCFKCQCTASS